jgi:programmed cell death 6-interacting protein
MGGCHAEAVRDDVRTGNDLFNQFGEGVTFYSSIQDHIGKLRQMCSDYIIARRLDSERRTADLKHATEAAANEEAARRFQQMDLAYAGSTQGHGAPPPAMQAPSGVSGPPAPHMYPQHNAPTPGGPSPYSMYPPPAAPPAPALYGQPPPAPYGGNSQPQVGPYQVPGHYYQPQTYPPHPPPR